MYPWSAEWKLLQKHKYSNFMKRCLIVVWSFHNCLLWLFKKCWVTKFWLNILHSLYFWNQGNIRHIKSILLPYCCWQHKQAAPKWYNCSQPNFCSADAGIMTLKNEWIITKKNKSSLTFGLAWFHPEASVA